MRVEFRIILLLSLFAMGLSACTGSRESLRGEEGYAQAVTAPPGSRLYLEQLAKAQPDNADAFYDLAISYGQEGRLGEAEKAYRQAVIIQPTHVPAAVNLADLYRSRGNYDLAIEVLEELFQTGVDDPRARTNLAGLYRMTGRLDESLRQSIAITRKYGVIYGAKLNVGLIYYDRGHYDMALTVLNDLLRDNPDDAVLRSSIGQVYMQTDKLLQAEAEFQKAVSIDTEHVPSLAGLGLVSLRKDEAQEAVDYFDKAIAADVNYAQAYVNRGVALRKLGRFDEAADDYRRALEINPSLLEAHYNLGVLHDDYARDFTEAIVVWSAFQAREDFPSAMSAEVSERLSRLDAWKLEWEEQERRRLETEAALAEQRRQEEEAEARAAAEAAEAAAQAEAMAAAATEATEAARLDETGADDASAGEGASGMEGEVPPPALEEADVMAQDVPPVDTTVEVPGIDGQEQVGSVGEDPEGDFEAAGTSPSEEGSGGVAEATADAFLPEDAGVAEESIDSGAASDLEPGSPSETQQHDESDTQDAPAGIQSGEDEEPSIAELEAQAEQSILDVGDETESTNHEDTEQEATP